jgi:hypothetical protein
MEKQLKWQPIDLDLHTFMNYVRSMGATSIKEIKEHFHTDSASVRRTIGFLYHHNKIWLASYNRGIYVTENTGKRGPVNVPALRKAAGVVNVKRGPKPKPSKKKFVIEDHPQTTNLHEWRDEKGVLKVDLAEDW